MYSIYYANFIICLKQRVTVPLFQLLTTPNVKPRGWEMSIAGLCLWQSLDWNVKGGIHRAPTFTLLLTTRLISPTVTRTNLTTTAGTHWVGNRARGATPSTLPPDGSTARWHFAKVNCALFLILILNFWANSIINMQSFRLPSLSPYCN